MPRYRLPLVLQRLPQPVEVALHGTVQEFLTGIFRSSAPRVSKCGSRDQGFLRLEVGGVGQCLSPSALQDLKEGFGDLAVAVVGMRERINILGGCLEIKSTRCGGPDYGYRHLTAWHHFTRVVMDSVQEKCDRGTGGHTMQQLLTRLSYRGRLCFSSA